MTDTAAKTQSESSTEADDAPRDFIREIVRGDLAEGRVESVITRFPPEPNGYLHIGHAKSICLNFGVAAEFGGRCNLRFDDTNPVKEEVEFIDAIGADVRWLGFDWGEHLHYASDYFDQLYEWAEHLIREGHAYVDDLSAEEIREYRGTLTEPGRNSPHRERSPDENLDLFRRMRAGEFADGARVLRAKIDMASGNINLRDPVLYRILHAEHPRTGDAWCVYPTYDFAHGQSDAIEGITHSLCTLEFEDHRPLYDWLIEHLPVPSRPRQYEFARLNLTHTVLSKRRLMQLVADGHVAGWDDPRLPTLVGMKRRGRAAGGDPRFCPADRRCQGRQPGRGPGAGGLHPRVSQSGRGPAYGGTQPAQGGDREPPGRDRRVARCRQQSRGPGGRHPQGAVRVASSGSSATTFWRTRPRSSSASPPAARCDCATPISSPAPMW